MNYLLQLLRAAVTVVTHVLFTVAAIGTGDRAISAQVQASGGSPHHHGNTWEKRGRGWMDGQRGWR